MYLYIRGGWTNVVWGVLMAVWGDLMAVWGGLEVVWWRFGVVWGVLGWFGVFQWTGLGPNIYRSPPKNIRNFKHPKKIFEILSTQNNIPDTLSKYPKKHRNDH